MRIIRYLVINLILMGITAWICLQARETQIMANKNVKPSPGISYELMFGTRNVLNGWVKTLDKKLKDSK